MAGNRRKSGSIPRIGICRLPGEAKREEFRFRADPRASSIIMRISPPPPRERAMTFPAMTALIAIPLTREMPPDD